MTNKNTCPLIDINIACEGWPDEDELDELILIAITAAVDICEIKISKKAELSFLFCDDTTIQQLNSRFRNVDKPTNVLSFPHSQLTPGEAAGEQLGDLAFALETISREALLENKPFDYHLSHLIIHGFLHLLGYDHENDSDANIMENLEIAALANLGIKNPYLEL